MHQDLSLTEVHHSFDPLLWESILEGINLSIMLGGWIIWIHEKLQLDPLRLVRVRRINIVDFLHIGNNINEGGIVGVLTHRRRQSSRRFGKTTPNNCLD
jgi:hypothetical protein